LTRPGLSDSTPADDVYAPTRRAPGALGTSL